MALDYQDLSPEQMQKGMACKTVEEFVAFVREEGLDLDEAEAQAANGSSSPTRPTCSRTRSRSRLAGSCAPALSCATSWRTPTTAASLPRTTSPQRS